MDKDFEENPLMMITVGGMIVSALFAAAMGWVTTQSAVAVRWMLDHGLLVPAQEALIRLGEGGLDLARIVLVVAVILLALVVTVMISSRVRTARRRRALRELTM